MIRTTPFHPRLSELNKTGLYGHWSSHLSALRYTDAQLTQIISCGRPFSPMPAWGTDCGGPMNLASLEPHPTRSAHELKTFECQLCAAQQVFTVEKRQREQN